MIGQMAGIRFMRLLSAIPNTIEHPPGVMIVADADMGKTHLLTHVKSPKFQVISDITGYGIEQLVLELRRGSKKNVGYVIVPEMARVMHRNKSFDQLLAMLNLLLEEGLRSIHRADFSVTLPEPLRLGFIGAITLEDFKSIQYKMSKGGTLSRMIIYKFGYSPSDIDLIKREIMLKENGDQRDEFVILEREDDEFTIYRKVSVDLRRVTGYIERISDLIGGGSKTGFRAVKQVRKLIKASTFLRFYKKGDISDKKQIVASRVDAYDVFSLIPFIQQNDSLPAGIDLEYKILKFLWKYKTGLTIKQLTELTKYPADEVHDALGILQERGLIFKALSNYYTEFLRWINKQEEETYSQQPEETNNQQQQEGEENDKNDRNSV